MSCTVYPKKYEHGFVVLCFVVVIQSFIMNSPEVFIHIHQGCFAGTGAIVRLPQCQWSKPDGYGKIYQCITTTKHSKAKTVCIFLGIYCMLMLLRSILILVVSVPLYQSLRIVVSKNLIPSSGASKLTRRCTLYAVLQMLVCRKWIHWRWHNRSWLAIFVIGSGKL